MDLTHVALFDLADRRLNWLGRRQAVLAQNVANVDTPGWKPRDLEAFSTALSASAEAGSVLRTNPAHLTGTVDKDLGTTTAATPTGQQPDGNAVSLDTELTKLADTETTQALTTSIYQSYLGLFRTALGGSGTG